MRMQNLRNVYERIFVPSGRSEYISQTGIRLSPYRGKSLVALVDLLAEIRTVTVESYETYRNGKERATKTPFIKTNRV